MKKVGHQGWCGPATGTQAFFKLLYLFRCRPFCISTHFSCLPDHRQRSASQVSDRGYLFANGGDHLFQFSCLFEKPVIFSPHLSKLPLKTVRFSALCFVKRLIIVCLGALFHRFFCLRIFGGPASLSGRFDNLTCFRIHTPQVLSDRTGLFVLSIIKRALLIR